MPADLENSSDEAISIEVQRADRGCTEEVTRGGLLEPCEKPGVALRIDPTEGTPYVVCARHVRADMVPLSAVIAAVRAEAVADERQRIAQLIREHSGPEISEGVCAGVQRWPTERARGYTASINEVIEEVIGTAAGSVPVATRGNVYCDNGLHSIRAGETCQSDPCRVATPAEPEEPRCLKDGATFEEHYERGITEGREAAAEEAAAAVVKLKTAAGERLALNYTVRDHSRVDDFLAAEQAIRLHFLRAAASPAAEPPAASWGDLAADVMGLVDQTLNDEAPVPAEQPAPWFRETRESLAMLDEVRAEVAAVEAAAEEPGER